MRWPASSPPSACRSWPGLQLPAAGGRRLPGRRGARSGVQQPRLRQTQARRRCCAGLHHARDQGHVGLPQCQRRPGLWDIGDSTSRKRSAAEVARDPRERLGPGRRRAMSCSTISTTVPRSPSRSRFYGTDTRKLQELTQAFVKTMQGIKGRGGCGLFRAGPAERAADRNGPRPREPARHLGQRCRPGAARGLCRRGSGRLGGPTSEARDVAVRLHPADRVDAANIERLPIAVSGTNRMVPLDQIATVTMGKGPGQIQHADGKRTIWSAPMPKAARPRDHGRGPEASIHRLPPGFGIDWPAPRGSADRLHGRDHGAAQRHRPDVLRAGHPVQQPAGRDALAAPQPLRRGGGADPHAARST